MNETNQKQRVNTPYDDVFRTLLNDCSDLVLPVIKELFGIQYSGEERIEFYPNEHFINQKDGAEEKRITDSCFKITGKQDSRKFLYECQSTADHSMLIRIFEYATQIALDQGKLSGNTLTVTIPHCAILFLRSNKETPNKMSIQIKTPEGSVAFSVMVMKIKSYALSEIFEKELLFLLPFYIFTYEKEFPIYEKDAKKLRKLKEEYAYISLQLETLQNQGNITAYTKTTLLEMMNKVVENIARKYDNIRKGVKSIMGGKILEYEAKTILNQGKAIGLSQGKEIGLSQGLSQGKEIGLSQGKKLKLIEICHIVQNAMHKFHLSAEEACDILGVDLAEYHEGEKFLNEKE